MRPEGIDGSWYGFSETQVRRVHGPFELVFIPVSARGFALFTQQDIGQFRKRLGVNINDVFLLLKYDGNCNWWDFHTIRKAQM